MASLTMMKRSWCLLAILVVAAAFLSGPAAAWPRTRALKDHRRTFGGDNSIRSVAPSCGDNAPCGWALYHQRSTSSLRRGIFEYTRNTNCECSAQTDCMYNETRQGMRAYVFYCRKSDDRTRDVYRFPNYT